MMMMVVTTMSSQVGRALGEAIFRAGWDLVPPDALERIHAGDITMGEFVAVTEALGVCPEEFLRGCR